MKEYTYLGGLSTRHISSATVSAEPINLDSTSDSSELDFTCECCAMEMYTCNCGLDADIFEGDDQYRRRYARCSKRDELACGYFHLMDPDFPERAREVMEVLVRGHALERDWVLDEHNAQLWSREEDMAEVETLRKLLGVAVVAIAILLAIGMR
ncbi:hypothetical protein Cgig2_032846 [Carnegiea gigantea]|uniref:Uncharacterized protein n=1 Tax=Carnegiea gigantea TaxID=171969 RepID=A0A9Q1JJG0_9CARY|nr:hypothetical protein Cgig2_032846 [Carnegiea gigantea]